MRQVPKISRTWMGQARSAGAESVLGVPSPPDGMTLVKQMKELDFTPKFLLLLRGSDSHLLRIIRRRG